MIRNMINKIKEFKKQHTKMIHCCDFCGCCFFYKRKNIHTDPQDEHIHYIVCPQCKLRTAWVERKREHEVSIN